MIRTQLDALELLVEMVRASRPLTVFSIRRLHQAITASQKTYDATDALGRTVHAPLRHGQWKTQPNHVRRPGGTLLEYTPPEHVEAEMDRLVELLFAELEVIALRSELERPVITVPESSAAVEVARAYA
ncbi:MAG: hypothetical protein ACRDYA_19080, partial [Egibacteraceae bacterium]